MVDSVSSGSTQMIHDLVRNEKMSVRVTEVTDEVMELVQVLGRIQNMLENAHNTERVVNHIETIRYLSYGIEDVLETCAVEVAFMFQQKDETCIRRLINRYCGVVNDAIEHIREKISDMEPEITSFLQVFPDDGGTETNSSIRRAEESEVVDRSVRWPRLINPRGIEDHFVGMEDDLETLTSLVVKDQKHTVISILGVKGLGKTTIARKVYNHPDVRHCFKAFAWVSLGQEHQIRNLLQDILRQLGPRKVKQITEEHNMIDQLKEIQRQKRCFVVLDGVWEIDQWEHISAGFEMEAAIGTKILLTTREGNIADVGLRHELRLLSEDEGWELLKKHAFPRKDGPDFGMLPKLGREMVKNCGYLPLAISSVGKNLSSKISLGEWQMMNNDVANYLQRDYHNNADERLFNILDSHYDNLKYYQKQCFLYLGIFREDEDIDAEDAIFLWMAEGLISSVDQGTQGTMIDTAEYYLSKLAFSGMLQVQVDELSATRKFKLCCLGNRQRELSLYQGEKEDFRLKVVDCCDGKQPRLDLASLGDGTRRLVIHFNKQVNLCEHDLLATDHLRSLLFLNSDQKQVDIPLRISDFAKFKLLRVLHFVRCKFEGRKLPKGIDKLVNLRYFGVLYCDLDELPPSISNLRNLHVLNVRVYVNAQIAIPSVLSQLTLLKHLRLPDYSDREHSNKLKLNELIELETLIGFNCHIHDISELSELKKLRYLVTHAYSNDSLTSIIKFVKYYGARTRTNLCIENKCNFISEEGFSILEEVLMCPNLHALTLSMVLIYKFPDCGIHASSDITEIKLIGCKIKEDPMEALGKFLNLKKLCLGYGAFVGREMIIRNRGFLNLEYLEFRSLPNLEEWRVDEYAMKNLSALTIRRCPKLENIPDGLTSISTLKSFEIELAPQALADGREAEYYQNFNFVPSFNIRKLDLFSCQ